MINKKNTKCFDHTTSYNIHVQCVKNELVHIHVQIDFLKKHVHIFKKNERVHLVINFN